MLALARPLILTPPNLESGDGVAKFLAEVSAGVDVEALVAFAPSPGSPRSIFEMPHLSFCACGAPVTKLPVRSREEWTVEAQGY